MFQVRFAQQLHLQFKHQDGARRRGDVRQRQLLVRGEQHLQWNLRELPQHQPARGIRGNAGPVRTGLHRWPPREHTGHLRSAAILQDANRHQYVHCEPGDR